MEESQAPEAAQFVSEGQLAHQAALRIIESEEQAKPETEAAPKDEEPKEEVKEETQEAKAEEVKAEIRRLKLKYKGEELEKEEPEVIELAQKGFDYMQNIQALAKERDEFRSTSKKQLEAKVKEYDDRLQLAEQAIWQTLMPEIQSIDWNKLAQENPSEWAQKYQYVQGVNAKLAQIQAERQKINQQREVEQQTQMQSQAKQAVEVLQKDIPGWSNDLYAKILKSGVDSGFDQKEVNAITDPRAIKVLWKAMQFDELQRAKAQVEKKVAAAPKVAKPGAGEKPDPSAEAWNKGMAKLNQSGGRDMRVATELAKRFL